LNNRLKITTKRLRSELNSDTDLTSLGELIYASFMANVFVRGVTDVGVAQCGNWWCPIFSSKSDLCL